MAPTEAFYQRVLEFTVTDRGQLPSPSGPRELVFLSRDPDEHHQIVLVSGRPEPLAFNVINQVSLRADSLQTLRAFGQRLRNEGRQDIQTVTHGNALSIYLRAQPAGLHATQRVARGPGEADDSPHLGMRSIDRPPS